MNPTILLAAILAVPIIVLMALRINAALVFLSLCLGNVLVQFIGPDAGTILSSTSAHTAAMAGKVTASQSYVDVVLLLLPVATTMVIMIRSVHGRAKLAFNVLPAIGVGLLTALLAVPLLSVNMTSSITALPLWRQLNNLQTLILGVSTLLCLFFLWMQRPKAAHDEGKHHRF